ncbi:MAG: methionyl-tRNA formyltransferase [Bdellovibrionia bacterium]
MSKIRIAFLGTPEYAAICLKALLADEHYEVVGVVTQPDRPAGRKLVLTPSPVKQVAMAHGLKVISPESLKNSPVLVDEVRSWGADVGVVVAFGQILTEDFMGMFPFGCVNIHASLLPRWRGAAPIQRAIEAGDSETGVALQKMVKKLDAGKVLGVRKVAITPSLNSLQLHDILAALSCELLHVELMDYLRGNLAGIEQDESQVTYAKKIEKIESALDWNLPAEVLDRKIRALAWGPGTFTVWQTKKIKIHQALVLAEKKASPPGTVMRLTEEGLDVATGNGVLRILELQPESRNRMKVADFIKGQTLKEGDVLGV